MKLNQNIKILSNSPIINSKASEKYVPVKFIYKDSVWEGFVPIEYRRTGTFIDFDDKNKLFEHLNYVYEEMNPNKMNQWIAKQSKFWKTKPNAQVTKEFYDILEKGGWKCGKCQMPINSNPQRRIQDLKEFGYTISTNLKMYCPNCKKNTSQRMLLPIPRESIGGNGYETWSPQLRKRIVTILNCFDVYEYSKNQNCLPDHKFSEIRWDNDTKAENPDTMTDEEIKLKFQLLTNQRNQQKREVCRNCYQTGKRGVIFGIPYFYEGGPNWDKTIPRTGKAAEKGCIGCPWYDIEKWREMLIKKISESR